VTKQILKAMLWKEWRETRWKWLAFACAFHIPLFIAGLTFALRESARFDLYALSDSVAAQALEFALVFQSGFLITAGLFLLAFFAVGSIGAELDNRSMFFLFERPVRRWQVLLFKYVVGAVQTTTCVGLSLITTLTVVYFVMAAAASNVTLAGSWDSFVLIVSNGVRGAVWTTIIALMVYSATFLFSVWFEKWWIAVIAGAVSLVLMFYYFGSNLIDWVISRAARQSEGPGGGGVNLEFYSRLELVPILAMLLISAGLYMASQYVFARKEMR
jgi:ABC-type transport system involved in multi-copper enzyme maturation permease subunit